MVPDFVKADPEIDVMPVGIFFQNNEPNFNAAELKNVYEEIVFKEKAEVTSESNKGERAPE